MGPCNGKGPAIRLDGREPQGEQPRQLASPLQAEPQGVQRTVVIIAAPARLPGLFAVTMESGPLLCAGSRQPLFDAARVLLDRGHDPAGFVVLRRAGSDVDCLRARVGAAAKLTVTEEANRPPRFRRWQPRNMGEGSARIAPGAVAATCEAAP
jgi:hypothetical protein